MLYKIIKRMVERGMAEGLAEKLDVFFAADRLTADQYTELHGLLTARTAD